MALRVSDTTTSVTSVGVGQVDLTLHHEHLRAMVDGVLGEGVAVGFHADDAEERVAGLDFITR